MTKFADLEKTAADAEARAKAAEERAATCEAAMIEMAGKAMTVTKLATEREALAARAISAAEVRATAATSLERMLRQDLWRETFLAYLGTIGVALKPEEAVAFARRAADAAALLVPPVYPPPKKWDDSPSAVADEPEDELAFIGGAEAGETPA